MSKLSILIEIEDDFEIRMAGFTNEGIEYQLTKRILDLFKDVKLSRNWGITILDDQEAEAIQIGKSILSLVDERINNLKVKVEKD